MEKEKNNDELQIEKREQNATMNVCITATFITTFMGSALNLSIPSMGSYYHVSAAFVGWVITAYMLTAATLSVPFGKIADTTGRRRILIIGILLFSLSGVVSVFAPVMQMMIVCRVLQGTAGAMIFATNTAILISAFPASQRGKVLGKLVASTYVGLSAGPVIGGLLNYSFGWKSIFIVSAAVSMFSFIVAVTRLPKGEKLIHEGKHDYAGNIIYILMIVLAMYGLSSIKAMKFAWVLIICGVALGFLFARVELAAENPLVNVRIFAVSKAFTMSNIAALLNYGATFAIGYLMSIYLQVVMGYSSLIAGVILIAQPVVMAALSPAAGRWSDKVPPWKIASIGMGICAACLLFFAYVSTDTPLWAIIAALLVTGVGFALFSSPNTNAIMACVEQKNYSVASSILATMRSLGHTSSMAIVTVIVGMYLGSTALADATPEDIITTMHTAFLIFVGLCVVGLFMSLQRKKA